MILGNILPFKGSISGSIGNFVICTIDGRSIVRRKALNPRDANSAAQKIQRASFKLIVEEYKSFGGFIDLGFTIKKKYQSPYNRFMSINLPRAIDKTTSEPVVDYKKLMLSCGLLNSVKIKSATIDSIGIKVSYYINLLVPSVSASDEVIAVAKTKNNDLLIARQARGSDEIGTIILPNPNIKLADVKCCYLFVLSANGKKSSDSVYVEISES